MPKFHATNGNSLGLPAKGRVFQHDEESLSFRYIALSWGFRLFSGGMIFIGADTGFELLVCRKLEGCFLFDFFFQWFYCSLCAAIKVMSQTFDGVKVSGLNGFYERRKYCISKTSRFCTSFYGNIILHFKPQEKSGSY